MHFLGGFLSLKQGKWQRIKGYGEPFHCQGQDSTTGRKKITASMTMILAWCAGFQRLLRFSLSSPSHRDDSTSLVMVTSASDWGHTWMAAGSSEFSLITSRAEAAAALQSVPAFLSESVFCLSAEPQHSLGAHWVRQESSQRESRDSVLNVTNSGWMVVAWMPSSWKKSLMRLATSM